MIIDVIRRTDWRALLIPVGAALLGAGVRQLEQRRDAVTDDLSRLDELVTLRRAQLDGAAPLDEPTDAAGPPAAGRGRAGGWAAGGLGALAGLALLRYGPMLAQRLDEHYGWPARLDTDGDALPDPWQHARPVDEPAGGGVNRQRPPADEPPAAGPS